MLTGFTVIDLGRGMAGVLPGKLAAELGGRVIRPSLGVDDPFERRYAAYAAWNAAKEAVQLDTVDKLHELLAGADACIVGGEDHPDLGLATDVAELTTHHPRLVVLEMIGGPAGAGGALPAHDLLAQARTGLAWEQSDARPIAFGVRLPTYGAVVQALLQLMSALCRREITQRGERVQASLLEGAAPWLGASRASSMRKDDRLPVVQCADGKWIFVYAYGPASTEAVARLLGASPPTDGSSAGFGDVDALARGAREWQAPELQERLIAEGVVCEIVQPPGECWEDEQLACNGTIATTHDGTRYVRAPLQWA